MEFEEVFMSQFTTPTTCYSGARKRSRSDTLRLATENHILGVSTSDDFQTTTTCDTVPRDNTTVICVGFSQCENEDDLQALALVDAAQSEDVMQPETPITLYQPPPASGGNTNDDTVSVVSTVYSIPEHHRRPSGNVAVSTPANMTTTSSTGNLTTATNTTGTSTTSNEASSMDTTAKHNKDVDVPEKSSSKPPPKARLILQTPQEEYFAFLDFRPLCPCVARWGDNNNNNNNNNMGIWLGSADDAVLRLYIPDANDRILHSVPLPEEHFAVDTPVMALDFITYHHHHDDEDEEEAYLHILAVACQDGTIQLLSWRNGTEFTNIKMQKVIVDGPLVTLQLVQQQESLRVLVGSLCGYVCQLAFHFPEQQQQQQQQQQQLWEGPFMIVQGFWNEATNTEDSVLAVFAWDGYIAIGTHSGRCMLYRLSDPKQQQQQQQHGQQASKVWECRLPYSVHGIVALAQDPLRLVVTTRRSLHIFQSKMPLQELPFATTDVEKTKNAQSPVGYSADLAKQRLLQLLEDPASIVTTTTLAPSSDEQQPLIAEAPQIDRVDASRIGHQEEVSPPTTSLTEHVEEVTIALDPSKAGD